MCDFRANSGTTTIARGGSRGLEGRRENECAEENGPCSSSPPLIVITVPSPCPSQRALAHAHTHARSPVVRLSCWRPIKRRHLVAAVAWLNPDRVSCQAVLTTKLRADSRTQGPRASQPASPMSRLSKGLESV